LQAVVLAGGKGTRLRPYTAEIPKPLVTVGDKPIIEILLRQMEKSGVGKVHIAVNHLAHLIMAVLGDGAGLGMDIVYSHEATPLSTVGPIRLIENLPEHFIVANGDILTDLDFKLLYDAHVKSRALLTVATHRRTYKVDYGVLDVNADGTLTGFHEKPQYTCTVSMGIYVFSREIVSLIPPDQKFGFDDLMLTLLNRHEHVNLFPYDGYWLDIGRPEDYEQANQDIEKDSNFIE
jgi:NDP-sugar pyrophosphorylase family protein